MDQESGRALIDAIRLHGVGNTSLLSKFTGMPVETVRYGVWHELAGHGIFSDIELDFELMGLQRWVLNLTFSNHVEKKTIFGFLRTGIGAIFGSSVLPTKSVFSQLLIPPYEEHCLQRILDWLATMKYIETYELQRVKWLRPTSLNLDYYDVRSGSWDIEWEAVEKTLASKKKLDTPAAQYARTRSSVDAKDILLIQRLQAKLLPSISKLAKSIGIDAFNARYHYNHHVTGFIKGYVVRSKQDNDSSFIFSYKPVETSDLMEARACALSLPFTTIEWQTEDKYEWLISSPPNQVSSTFRYVSKHFSVLKGELKFEMLDNATEFRQSIPDHMFDETRNRWIFEPKISLDLFNTSFDALKSHCEYYKSEYCTYERGSSVHPCQLSVCPFITKSETH